MEETRYHRQKEEEYGKLIKELKQDVKEIEGEVLLSEMTLNPEQYKLNEGWVSRSSVRGKNVWTLVGLPKNLKGEDLEVVLSVFEEAGASMEKHNFHVIHILHNRVVVAEDL